MKIMHLLSQKPKDTGSGITVQAIIREASRKGHQNYLLAAVSSGEDPKIPYIDKDSCLFVEFENSELPMKIVGMSDVMPYPSMQFCKLTPDQVDTYKKCLKSKLLDAVKKFKPDIIHSNHLWILTSIARQAISDIPVIATSHGSDLRQLQFCPHLRETVLSGCSELDCIIVLSSAHRDEVMRNYYILPQKIEIVGAGYDEELFTVKSKSTEGPVEIVYAGKLSRAKGVIWLIEALSRIIDLPWHLHLAGSGSGTEQDEVLEKAASLGKRTTIHGPLPQKALAEIMGKAHIFALPSFFEGFPLVLVEALASGCLIIATELLGVKEIFSKEDFNDFLSLVPLPRMEGPDTPRKDDLPPFIEHLRDTLRTQIKKVRQGHNPVPTNIRLFLKDFTWKRVFERVEKIYLRLYEK